MQSRGEVGIALAVPAVQGGTDVGDLVNRALPAFAQKYCDDRLVLPASLWEDKIPIQVLFLQAKI